jgi:putative nuclease sbcCD, D subunit
VRAVVIDPDRPAEMAERIRRAFPHALEIQHRAASGGGAHRRADVAAMDPVRVLDLFMSSAGNRPLDAAESALLADAWESALAASNREARS